MGAVLVHIDLDGEQPHPAAMTALAAGRAVASSWGATLYAAIVIQDGNAASDRPASDTGRITNTRIPAIENARAALARAGADKVVVAMTEAPVSPLWASVGAAWQGVLDHLRPRLVLFGADAPSTAELGPRTAARIGARLLVRARVTGVDHVELRDRDGGYVRVSDGGAAVVLVGANVEAETAPGDDDIDLVVLTMPGGADARIEVAGSAPAELAHTGGALVVLGDDVISDLQVVSAAKRLARLLDAHVVGGPAAARNGTIAPGAVIERGTPLAPELCVAIGTPPLDLAGATSLVRIGTTGGKHVDGALAAPIAPALVELVRALEEP
ncbi:MAG TPA: hypothetical protein VFQ53_40400 [Kofleriaceae bacterium]|nr:hypothetical protein [Kofleriaceae bacterium]